MQIRFPGVVAGARFAALSFLVFSLSSCGNDTADDLGACAGWQCGQGHCVLRDNTPECLCDTGYRFVGQTCVADPCSPDPCAYGACRVVGERAVCSCDTGYTGDLCDRCAAGYTAQGMLCVLGDPCTAKDPCVFGVCSIKDGETHCACRAGYDGQYCEQCAKGYHSEELQCVPDTACSPNPCAHGTCRVADGKTGCDCALGYDGARCDECATGYEKDGVNCVALPADPCSPNPCIEDHRGVCTDQGGSALCQCDQGYVYDGAACVPEGQTTDPCLPDNPCKDEHKTTCVNASGSAKCLCDAGFAENAQGACETDLSSIPTRTCGATLRYQGSASEPMVVAGEFNGWSTSATPMTLTNGVWTATIDTLAPGDYAYKLVDKAGKNWRLDPNNPFTKYVGGAQNSRLIIPDCQKPLLVLDGAPVTSFEGGKISFAVHVEYGRNKRPLNLAKAVVKRNGEALPASVFDPKTGLFTIQDSGLTPGKYAYLFTILDADGLAAEPLFVPLWIEKTPFAWNDALIYFVFTDRFANGDKANDAPTGIAKPGDWQGGDFKGLLAKLKDGYFDSLGVNTLWISSPYMNTQKAWPGSDGHSYAGYHSYWPTSIGWTDEAPISGLNDPFEPHFGSLDDFKAIVKEAHARGMRVLVDFVANHVHQDSPVYTQHKNASPSWFNWDNGKVGQAYVCGWDKPIECWFASYLPDFDYKNLEVTKTVMNSALWLIEETNIDGFRLDAVKHMVLDFSSTLRGEIDRKIDTTPDVRFYMVGETFTGEGDGERQTIKYYLGQNLLDGQFDFPLFYQVMAGFLRNERGLYDIKNFVEGNDTYYSNGIATSSWRPVMSTFMGNHDVSRALSQAAGQIGDMWGNAANGIPDAKTLGWTNPPPAPNSDTPYKKLVLAWAFLMTQPGAPMIYYGDEIGMPGAGDPDNRRFMRFGGELSARETAALNQVRKLGQARAAHAALRQGARTTLKIENDYWVYSLRKDNDRALVLFNRADNARTETFDLSSIGLSSGTMIDVLSGARVTLTNGRAAFDVGARQAAVFIAQ